MKWSAAQRRYSSSPKGKTARLKYQQSLKGIETRKRYMAKHRARLAGKEQVEIVIKEPEIQQEPAKVIKETKS